MARDVLVRLVGIFRRMRVAEPTTRLSWKIGSTRAPIHEPLVRPSHQSSYEAVAQYPWVACSGSASTTLPKSPCS